MVRDLKLSRSFEYVTKIICTNNHADQTNNFKVSAKFLDITLVNFILIIFLQMFVTLPFFNILPRVDHFFTEITLYLVSMHIINMSF